MYVILLSISQGKQKGKNCQLIEWVEALFKMWLPVTTVYVPDC